MTRSTARNSSTSRPPTTWRPARASSWSAGTACDNGDDGNQGLFDADTAILDGKDGHPLATIASNSWNSGDEGQAAVYTRIENAYLVRAAAEGVGMYFSSGDTSGVEMPSSDPYATAVGGTALGIGASGNRLFETGWSNGVYTLTRHHTWLFPRPGWPRPAAAPACCGASRPTRRAWSRPR